MLEQISNKDQNTLTLKVTFFRSTFRSDDLIEAGLTERNNTYKGYSDQANRFRVENMMGHAEEGQSSNTGPMSQYSKQQTVPSSFGVQDYNDFEIKACRLIRWRYDDIGAPLGGTDVISQLSLSPDALAFVAEAEHWLKSEKRYKDRGIPHTRGAIIHGPTGNGRTSLARVLGQKLRIPVFAFDLATMTNRDLRRDWSTIRSMTPCIALFEDIDGVFEGRVNRNTAPDHLTFDCLLNCLSGIETADGILKIATTNRPESLDDALGKPVPGETISTRPQPVRPRHLHGSTG